MFVGCAALSVCPRRTGLGAPVTVPDEQQHPSSSPPVRADDVPAPEYRSPFVNWTERSSVRTSVRRLYTADDVLAPPIAPELVPLAQHGDVRALAPYAFREVLLQHLYRYLDFTVALETLVVNKTVLGIANGSVGVALPRQMRADAYKIYCDEGYHALFSVDLMQQIEDATGRPARLSDRPFFLRRLNAMLAGVDPAWRPLVELLFVVVSETLISATLVEGSMRSDMARSVRDVIRDHAVDEGRHHAYFAMFLRHLWPQLSATERLVAGRAVPDLVAIFLDPDLEGMREDLLGVGVSTDRAEQVLGDCFDDGRLLVQRQSMARQTLQYFTELGTFEAHELQERLHEQRLGG